MRFKLTLSHAASLLIAVAVVWWFTSHVIVPSTHSRRLQTVIEVVDMGLLVGGVLLTVLFVRDRAGSSKNVAVRHQAERESRESQELFRNAFNESPIGMSVTELDGKLLRVNPPLCELLGYTESELRGRTFQSLTHPDDLTGNMNAIDLMLSGQVDHATVEKRYVRKDGELVWALVNAGLAYDAEGRPRYMIGQVQDIGERKRAEAERHERQELFRSAFEESPIGMALATLDGSLVRVNAAFCRMLGYSEQELLALRFQQFTHPDDLPGNLELLGNLRSNERRHYELEKRYIRKDGEIIWVQLNVSAVLDASGQPTHMIGHAQNVTDRNRAEQELRAYASRLVETRDELEHRTVELAAKSVEAVAARRVAEEANRIKGAFLANMSHEIRTPLAAIIGFANLLLDDRLPETERAKSVQTIARHGQHLLALVNDVLDLSKIEADRMTVERIPCDPAQILADVEAMLAERAWAKGLPLVVHVAPNVPPRVRSDPTRLRQVMLNLISNAIKFTPGGEVRVELSAGEHDALRLVVIDTGIGMTADEIDRLFVPFNQADVSTTRRFGGTGLGLAICKRLVEMMHGRIDVTSAAGVGTTFEVTVEAPACDAVPQREPHVSAGLRPGLRVLLAEDGPDNQRLISFYLDHAGIDHEIAENGRVAVDAALNAAATGRGFDLVLMDMQMPELDGYAATAALRAAGLVMPVLALTAHGTAEQCEQSLKAGCAEHLVKPVEHDQLLAAIARHTAGHTPVWIDGQFSDDAAFAPVFAAYVGELPGQVAQLLELSADPNDPELRRLVHQIKGAAGGYGLPQVSAAAETAERAFDAQDVNHTARSVDALVTLLRRVRGYDSARELANAPTRTGDR